MPDTKQHGNTGNQNAKKPVTLNTRLSVRITPEQRARYEAAAEKAGLRLSEWVIHQLDSPEKGE